MSGKLESLDRLVEEFKKLPGIGRRTAERLAYHILRTPKEDAMALAYAVRDVKKNMRQCRECFNLTEQEVCSICADSRRDRGVICVVEQPRDVWAIEKTGTYDGLYHVLLGRLAPLEDMGPDDLTVNELVERVSRIGAREVIIATNPNLEGDGTAAYVRERLATTSVKVTRIARGIPAGSSIEYSSTNILQDALAERRNM
ncbi:MAG: recombination protein RecR [Planctomycetes bacterium]|nr:recombination protein RecR [Planctomycetota bacterium]